MPKYRKKPVIIEAMQWTGENIHDLWDWITAEFLYGPISNVTDSPYLTRATPARLYVAANDAWLDIEIGEWIIRDLLGFYPCKPDIFADSYELCEEDPIPNTKEENIAFRKAWDKRVEDATKTS